VSQRTRAAPRLREAIRLYLAQHNEELDEHARKLLTRLASSDEAAEAFKRLKLRDDDEGPIIRACSEAENLARTFAQRRKKLEERLARREQRGNAAVILRGLLNEIWRQKQSDPLGAGPETDEDIEAMGRGLALFERRIFFEEDVVGRNLFWMKVTRKSKAPSKTLSAGKIAAIKWLADKVKDVTDNAHYGEIADLIDVIFGTEVSPDQVRAAHRARGHWQWLVRSLPEEMRKLPKAARSRAK
jgi:hypothetical protein